MERPTSPRRFFLADPDAPAPRLAGEEERHALSVLRIAAGERILGLDGKGGLHPLIVRRAGRGVLEFERDGEVVREPAPGSPGAPLPWIEVAAPLPKGARAEEMLDRLTQLGIAAFRPLACERTQGFAREASDHRTQRLRRAALEACKQARRAWLPRIDAAIRPEDLLPLAPGYAAVLLEPTAGRTLHEWSATLPDRPLLVIAGPEGGFSATELAALGFAEPIALGPYILRIETAVESAAATLVQAGYARTRRPAPG